MMIKPKMVDGKPMCTFEDCPRWDMVVVMAIDNCNHKEGNKRTCIPGLREQLDILKKENARLKEELEEKQYILDKKCLGGY